MGLSENNWAGRVAMLTIGGCLMVCRVGGAQVAAAAITTTSGGQKSAVPARHAAPATIRRTTAHKSTSPHATATHKAARTTVTRTSAAKTTPKASKAKGRTTRVRPLTGRQRLARLRLEPDRVTQIQEALGREGYLEGAPSGQWDDHTRSAMQHYQSDHGFPATGLPEAKSLMKLGLGSHPLPASLDPGMARASTPEAPRPVTGADPSQPSATPEAPPQPQ